MPAGKGTLSRRQRRRRLDAGLRKLRGSRPGQACPRCVARRALDPAQVPADVLIRRYRRPQNAISIARVSSRWKLGVGFSLIKKLL